MQIAGARSWEWLPSRWRDKATCAWRHKCWYPVDHARRHDVIEIDVLSTSFAATAGTRRGALPQRAASIIQTARGIWRGDPSSAASGIPCTHRSGPGKLDHGGCSRAARRPSSPTESRAGPLRLPVPTRSHTSGLCTPTMCFSLPRCVARCQGYHSIRKEYYECVLYSVQHGSWYIGTW